MAGLAAAIRLAARGEPVTLLEKQTYPGGKMRQLQVADALIDAGPTVFHYEMGFLISCSMNRGTRLTFLLV